MEFNGLFDNLTTIEMLVIKFFVALQVIFMVYGMIGLFLRYIKSESRTWRYISDASYWIYLLHLGLVCGLQVVLMTTNQMAGILKFPLIIIVTTVLTVTSYHYLVRNTIIGEYLHGKRKKQIE
jgi:glucan biosynthesis protein C